MARYVRNFADDSVSSPAAGLSMPLDNGGSHTVQTDATTYEAGKSLVFSNPDGSTQILLVDDFPTDESDVDIFARIKCVDIDDTTEIRIYWRYDEAADTGFYLQWKSNSLQLWKVTTGTEAAVRTFSGNFFGSDWVNVRVYSNGSDHKFKLWETNTEPSAWTATRTSAAVTGAGAVGIGTQGSGAFDIEIDVLSMADLPDTAIPLTEVPADGYLSAHGGSAHIMWSDPAGVLPTFGFAKVDESEWYTVDADWANGVIFAANASTTLHKWDSQGLNHEAAFTWSTGIYGVRLNTDDGYIFLTNTLATMHRYDYPAIDNQSVVTLTSSGNGMRAMYYNSADAKLYASREAKILSFDGDGSNVALYHTGAAATPACCAVGADYVYRKENTTFTKVAKSDKAETTIATVSLACVAYNTTLDLVAYVAGGKITHTDPDGSNPDVITEGTSFSPNGITHVSFAGGGGGGGGGGGANNPGCLTLGFRIGL